MGLGLPELDTGKADASEEGSEQGVDADGICRSSGCEDDGDDYREQFVGQRLAVLAFGQQRSSPTRSASASPPRASAVCRLPCSSASR